jgi:hypothetical protein
MNRGAEFNAPFMDISRGSQEAIQVQTMYHGQTWQDNGYNDIPHSAYWTTSLQLALGHALFGPEMEGDVEAIICEVCEGHGFYFPDDAEVFGRDCEFCQRGWRLPKSYSDEFIPKGRPIVWALDVSEASLTFIFDGESPAGISYILHEEGNYHPLDWYRVNDAQIERILHRWLEDDQIPEIVLEDTAAGYVSDEKMAWKRVLEVLGSF